MKHASTPWGLSILVSSLSVLAVAGEERAERMVVTPQGVFAETEVAPAGPAFKSSVNPDPSPAGAQWIYPSPVGSDWISEQVAAGNHGTFAWIAQNLNAERLSFAASTAFDPGFAPIYEDLLTGVLDLRIDAADKAPVAVAGVRNTSTGPHELRLYSGFVTTPLATQSVPVSPSSGFFKVAMSADGERLAVGYTDPASTPIVAVYDTTGGTALGLAAQLPGPTSTYRQHALSGDGNTVLFGTGTDDFVYDVNTATLVFQDASTVSTDAKCIDFDGDTWGRGGFDLGVWKHDGTTYQRLVNYNDPSLGFGVWSTCGISADGSTFVAGGYDAFDNDELRIACFSIGATSATLLWTYSSSGTGGKQDVTSGVALSDDGKHIVVSTWGDGGAAHPEVLIFDRDAGNVPVGGIDSAGSAFHADISGDGRFVVAGFKATHANDFGSGGEAVSYRRGGEGFWLEGTPSIGQSIALNIGGAPTDVALLAASFGLLPNPLPVGGFRGTFALDPGLLLFPPVTLGAIGASPLTIPAVIPAVPAAVGLTIYAQSIRTGSNALDNAVRLPLTP